MNTIVTLLVLPAIALASIDVELSGIVDFENSNLKIDYSGSNIDLVSDEERKTFKVSDDELKDAVASFTKRPDDVFLRSPTPWGDLYKTYDWQQVVRTLVPKSGRILKISSEPVLVLEQIFENNSSKPAAFNVGISQAVANSVSSSWSKGGELTVGQKISYGFDIKLTELSRTTSLSYTSPWGENAEKSQMITLGSSASTEILLQPGQAVVAQLKATRGTVKMQMEYEASLYGQLAANYAKKYMGHHFWGLDLADVMNKGNISNSLISREIIEFNFYSKSKIVVIDKMFSNKLFEAYF